MTFVKGYLQSKEHQRRAKEARRALYGSGVCEVCEDSFRKYSKNQKICSARVCKRNTFKLKYQKQKTEDPIGSKAFILFSTVRLGKDKTETARRILEAALYRPCKYCGTTIQLENASVDHKIPRTGSKVYDRKTKRMVFTKEEIAKLDSKENLQIICRNCNQYKGNFTAVEFESLLRFLIDKPDLKDKLLHRLRFSRAFFKGR